MAQAASLLSSLRKRSVIVIVVAALLATFAGQDSAGAASFAPSSSVSLQNSSPGANSDFVITFGIGLGANGQYGGGDDVPESNFSSVLAFTPDEFATADPADVPLGTLVAQLSSTATLGLINNACFNTLPVHFDMMAASTDINNVLPNAFGRDAGRNPGEGDDQFDVVNGLPLGVTKYPDYLKRILVDANGNPIKPTTRLYGQTVVADVDVSLNFNQFDPGTDIKDTKLDPAMGNVSVTVLLNVGDPEAVISPNPITDFCSPLATQTTVFGISKDNPETATNEGGKKLITNPPSDGTFNFALFAASIWDADDDGIENFLDPCPYTPNPNWDPRNLPTRGDGDHEDADADGLPNNCDPSPNGPNLPVNDYDGDFYVNRGDNCPVDKNGLAPGSDGLYGTGDDKVIGNNNQKDTDNDFIGDVCDHNVNTPDGHIHFVCNVTSVDVGGGGSAPPGPNLCTDKAIGIDLNGNGIFDSEESTGGGATPTATPTSTPTSGDGGGLTPTPTPTTGVSTTLTQPALAGDTELEVESTEGFATGDEIVINPDGATEEMNQIAGFGSILLESPLQFDHEAGEEVRVVSGTTGGMTDGGSTSGSGGGAGGSAGGPATGVGSLAPAASSVPIWATILSGLGGAGLLGSLRTFLSHIRRRRQ